ncbi:MAG: MBL fold metallo-hydrolase [Candidatus Rokubacteria bacterium]|nr:MBL fold metallo-hydrolase [Candidatus Rokubacteria bacterium]
MCLRLSGAGDDVLIDCGATSMVAMKRAGVDPNAIAWIVLTHLHGDHFGGLPFLILDGQFSRRSRSLTIAGPPTVEARVRAAMEVFFPGSTRVERRFPVQFVELDERKATMVGPAAVTAFPVVHASGAPSYAVRAEYGGKIVTYSGDTEWTETLVEAADGADVLVCEAYFFDKAMKFHLDYARLMRERHRLTCRRLVLAHMSRDMLDRRAEVQAETADDMQVLDL